MHCIIMKLVIFVDLVTEVSEICALKLLHNYYSYNVDKVQNLFIEISVFLQLEGSLCL